MTDKQYERFNNGINVIIVALGIIIGLLISIWLELMK